jgi:hypothetical protein
MTTLSITAVAVEPRPTLLVQLFTGVARHRTCVTLDPRLDEGDSESPDKTFILDAIDVAICVLLDAAAVVDDVTAVFSTEISDCPYVYEKTIQCVRKGVI